MRFLLALLCVLLLIPMGLSAHTVTVVVTDADTGASLPFRGHCVDSGDTDRSPTAVECYYRPADTSGFTKYESWWYADGTADILDVATGNATFGFGHGFEYTPYYETVNVTGDMTLYVELTRIDTMSDRNWYCGDLGSDLVHGPLLYENLDSDDAMLVARCEGLDVFGCMNDLDDLIDDPITHADGTIYMSGIEVRHWDYGHMSAYGMQSPIIASIKDVEDKLDPNLSDLADSTKAHGDNVLNTLCHPSEYTGDYNTSTMWPREAASIIMNDAQIDAYDWLSSSDGFWTTKVRLYHLWSCGFRLPCTGATDSSLSKTTSDPPGSIRTYAYLPEEPTFWTYINAIKAGRTFATNGPLITAFTVSDSLPGSVIHYDDLDEVSLDVVFTFESIYPCTNIEIRVNGSVEASTSLTGDDQMGDTFETTVTVSKGGAWINARVYGAIHGEDGDWYIADGSGGNIGAETSPVYVEMAHIPVYNRTAAEWLEDEIEDLEDYETNTTSSTWTNGGEETRIEGYWTSAKDAYDILSKTYTYVVGTGDDYGDLWTAFHDLANNGVKPNSYVIVDDGTQGGPGARLGKNNVTVSSWGESHRGDCVIRNLNANASVFASDSLMILRDFTFSTDATIDNSGEAIIRDGGQYGHIKVYDCDFIDCFSSQRQAGILMTSCEGLDLIRCLFNNVDCTGGQNDYGGFLLMDVNNVLIDSCEFKECDTTDRAPFFAYNNGITPESNIISNSLFHNNSSANYGILRLLANTTTYSPIIRNCTFADNTCTDTGDGVLNFEAIGGNMVGTLEYCVITGNNGNAISDTYDPTTCKYNVSWNNGGTETFYIETGTDTIGLLPNVNPAFHTTHADSTRRYMVSRGNPISSGTVVPRFANDHYMGWLRPTKTPAPSLTSPADGALNLDVPTFEWGSVDYADSFAIRIGNPCGTSELYSAQVSSDTDYTLAENDGRKKYWQIRSRAGDGWGPWSACRWYTTKGTQKSEILIRRMLLMQH